MGMCCSTKQTIPKHRNSAPGLSLNLCLFWHMLDYNTNLQGLSHPREKFEISNLIVRVVTQVTIRLRVH